MAEERGDKECTATTTPTSISCPVQVGGLYGRGSGWRSGAGMDRRQPRIHAHCDGEHIFHDQCGLPGPNPEFR